MKNSFAPLWTDILDSSVWLEAPHVRITWIGMIALQDADHVVRYDSFKLARRVNLPEEQVIDALRVLGEPDKRRIDPGPEEGRRILPMEDGGWKLVNGQKYVELMAAVRLRMQKARWAAKNREKQKQEGGELNLEAQDRGSNGRFKPPSQEECRVHAGTISLPEAQANAFWHFYESKGWKVGRSPMKNWHSAMAGWKQRFEGDKSHGTGIAEKRVDRSIGTANEGTAHLYANIGEVGGHVSGLSGG